MNTLILTAITALAPPFGVNVGGNQATLTINAATAIAEPFRINLGGTAGTNQAKFAPTRGTPIIVYWGHTGQLSENHPVWKDKSTWVCNFPSFLDGYYEIPGYPPPPVIGALNAGDYNTLDSNYKLNVSDSQLQSKINKHAERDAQVIADCLHKQGLIRGKGPLGGGNYGGAFSHHELFSDGQWKAAAVRTSFTGLLRHPDDAALVLRTQSLKVDEENYRADTPTTLFKLTTSGGIIGGDVQTVAGRAAIEANTVEVRPGNFHHLICTNGIAAAKRYVDALILALKEKCDSYDPPEGGSSISLCYPSTVLNDLEEFSFRAAFHSNQYLNAPSCEHPEYEPPAAGAGYYLVGVLWHVMGNYDCPNNTWEMPIFYSGENFDVPESYKSTIEGSSVLAPLYADFCPQIHEPRALTAETTLHFDQINCHAVDYAMYKAMNEPWKEAFPESEFSNYDFVIVKNGEIYERPGGKGTRSIQKILRQDRQAPSLYGHCGKEHVLVNAIRNAVGEEAVDEAVEAWNEASFTDVMKLVDSMDLGAKPLDAYIYGVYKPEQIRLSAATPPGVKDDPSHPNPTQDDQWGGDKAFFKKLVKALWKKGIYKYIIYSGDVDLTFEAWNEVQAEIRDGNFA